jgi:hypothetical protein
MLATNIPITDNGDIVVEKGVTDLGNGKLVDCWSGKFNNSVGQVVEIPREDVDPDREQTCSNGLHVGSPDYVRAHYSYGVIVTCTVNPADVVTVPTDYNNTKMRVCKYTVREISDKTHDALIVNFDDLLDTQELETVKNTKVMKALSSYPEDNSWTWESGKKMTAKQIKTYMKDVHGFEITLQDKNRKGIVKKAEKYLASYIVEA